MRNASTASERILRSGRSHEYLYQKSDSEHEYRHWLHSGVCILLCPQQRETLAYKLGIPVFMKEDLVPIIGDENMIQEMPEDFNKVLEVQTQITSSGRSVF